MNPPRAQHGEGDRAQRGGGVFCARQLRKAMSLPEVMLWQRLRLAEIKFRRQHPLGPYVLDFYCPKARLVVEIDGLAHDLGDRPVRDARRDTVMHERGLRVVRIAAAEVLADPDSIADRLVAMALPLHRPAGGPPPHALHGEDLAGTERMKPTDYEVDIRPLLETDGGGFVALIPDLPGCRSDGDTPHEALSNADDAIACWIEAAEEMGRPVPEPRRAAA